MQGDSRRLRQIVRYASDLGWRDALAPVAPMSAMADGDAGAGSTLAELAATAATCTACRLCEGRRHVVFGEGNAQPRLMLVGEGPGADEDRTGRPFVGQAGQLLDAMIHSLGFERGDVYIANVVKCRPPSNRNPEPDEIAACASFLDRQIELLKPRVILALGRVAADRLTGSNRPIGAIRGTWSSYRGTPLLATFHPAHLLYHPVEKRAVWDDLKKVAQKLQQL